MSGVWRVSLQRMRADWPIVAAAWLITVLSAVLFSAGVIYPAAAAEAGLQRALRDAPMASKSLDISRYDTPANAQAVDDRVAAAVQDIIAGGGSLVRDWRRTATVPLAARTGAAVGDQADFGYLEGIADHASLVEGAWPQEGVLPVDDTIDVALAAPAAAALGLHAGDLIDVVDQPKPDPHGACRQ